MTTIDTHLSAGDPDEDAQRAEIHERFLKLFGTPKPTWEDGPDYWLTRIPTDMDQRVRGLVSRSFTIGVLTVISNGAHPQFIPSLGDLDRAIRFASSADEVAKLLATWHAAAVTMTGDDPANLASVAENTLLITGWGVHTS